MKTISLILLSVMAFLSVTSSAFVQNKINKPMNGKAKPAETAIPKNRSDNALNVPPAADPKNERENQRTGISYVGQNRDHYGLVTPETMYVNGKMNMR